MGNKNQQRVAWGESLLKEITDDKTISDITKEELSTMLMSQFSQYNFNRTQKRLLEAQEGIKPVFKSRQNIQLQFETLTDMPGRRQSILGAGSRNNKFTG